MLHLVEGRLEVEEGHLEVVVVNLRWVLGVTVLGVNKRVEKNHAPHR